MSESPTITQETTEQELASARELFHEYARTLDCDPCLRSIEEDVGHLPGEYAPPGGGLLLAVVDGKAAGCVAAGTLSEVNRKVLAKIEEELKNGQMSA